MRAWSKFWDFFLFVSFICCKFAAQKLVKSYNMNTVVGTIPMDAVLTMLNHLSRHDRRWLVEQMSEQVEREEAEAKKSWDEYCKNALTW